MNTTIDTATIPFRQSPGYKGHAVLALNATLIGLTTIIVGLRLYVRTFLSKALGLDDLLAFLAYICVTIQSAFDIRSVNYGSGAHIQYVPPELMPVYFSTLVNNTLIYLVGVGLMRLSIVAFLRRLAKDLDSAMFFHAINFVGFTIIAQTLGCLIYRLLECTPIKDIWLVPNPSLNCVSAKEEQNNLIVHQTIGVFLDLSLFAIPVWVIQTKMIKSPQRLQLIFVFSIGLFVVVAGITRLVFMNTLLFLADPTYAMATLGPWTDLEGHTGLWVACFPALQPLIRSIPRAFGIFSKLRTGGRSCDNNSNKKSDHTKNIGVSRSWVDTTFQKKGYARNGKGVDADDASERGMVIPSAKSEVELESFSNEHGHIRKKVEYAVCVEERRNHVGSEGMLNLSAQKSP